MKENQILLKVAGTKSALKNQIWSNCLHEMKEFQFSSSLNNIQYFCFLYIFINLQLCHIFIV